MARILALNKGRLRRVDAIIAFATRIFALGIVAGAIWWSSEANAADGSVTKSISAGTLNSVVVEGDGSVWVWGHNAYGESGSSGLGSASRNTNAAVMTPVVSNVVAVATSATSSDTTPGVYLMQTLLLRNDGAVYATGDNRFDQIGQPSTLKPYQVGPAAITNLTNIVAIASGATHSLALKADGSVWAWGDNEYEQLGRVSTGLLLTNVPLPVTTVSHIVAVAAGYTHSLALRSDGTVWSWGDNSYGQLGNGMNSQHEVPEMVGSLSNVIAISAALYHSMALKADGTIWAWGNNSYGQVGDGNVSIAEGVPVQVTNLSQVIAISAGGYHSLALRQDGTVWGWGRNNYGQLWNAAVNSYQKTPVTVTNLGGVLDIAAGSYHSMALVSDGTIAAWGRNDYGQVGNGAPIGSAGSVNVWPVPMSGVGDVELTVNHESLVTKADGTVWAWGFNGFGRLGDETATSRSRPVQVYGLTEVAESSVGGAHSLAVKADGSVWAWGANIWGELGDGATAPQLVPKAVGTVGGIKHVSAGGEHSLALAGDGTVWAWGQNSFGQVGDGTITNQLSPVHLSGLSSISQVAAGGQHSLALSNGMVFAWGDNRYGQVGDGTAANKSAPVPITGLSSVRAVAAGDLHSLVLSNGIVYAFGDNQYGQLGDGTTVNRSAPVMVTNLSNIQAIGAGKQFSVALDSNGVVHAWGCNLRGQLGCGTTSSSAVPATVAGLSNVVSIQVFSEQVVAVLADGSVRTWGADNFGQLGIGVGGDQPVPVAIPGFYLTQPAFANYTLNTLATNTARYVRGSGPDFTYKSFVIPLDSETGVRLDELGDNADIFGASEPWFTRIARNTRHNLNCTSSVTNSDGSTTNTYDWTLNSENPIVAFGSSAGGSLLNIDQPYHFGIYAGCQYESTNSDGMPYISPVRILVYRKSDFVGNSSTGIVAIATNYITIPRRTIGSDQDAWYQFLTNGFTMTVETNGLRTTLQLVVEPPPAALTNLATVISTNIFTNIDPAISATWSEPSAGNPGGLTDTNMLESYLDFNAGPSQGTWGVTHSFTNVRSGPFTLTHTALVPDYCYVVEVLGVVPAGTNVAAMTKTAVGTNADWARLYSLDFDNPQPWRSVFISEPQFNGQPLPPAYLRATPLELTNLHAIVTNEVSTLATNLNLDQSPELRRHPTLDQFVSDMGYDPMALANYVQNQIELCNPLSYNEHSGSASAPTVTQDAVDRSALGVFMEGQGSPIEQCALLIYLLREAGYPAAYVFPTNNNVQMLDTRLSSLLQMQVHGAVDGSGSLYTTNSLITVNYPWVVTKIGTNYVHLFPWIKDTVMIEGLDLYDYLPEGYNSGQQWFRQYLFGDPKVLPRGMSTDLPSVLFPLFVASSLAKNYPDVSVTDIGMNVENRQHVYSRWEDFPTPNVVNDPTNVTIVDSLSDDAITNVFSVKSNIFNTVQARLYSVSNTNSYIDTGELRLADLHNRRFLMLTNGANMRLWLAPFIPGTTNTSNFGSDSTLTNEQYLDLPLSAGQAFGITVTHRQHKAINPSAVPFTNNYLGVFEQLMTSQSDRFVRTNEVTALCLVPGRVTQAMLDVHSLRYWQMQQEMATNIVYRPPLQDTAGIIAYIMGLDYFQQVDGFENAAEQLHKVHLLSWFSEGLCRLGFDHNGTTNLLVPTLDIYSSEMAYASSGASLLDTGNDLLQGTRDFATIFMAEMGAQEHSILDQYLATTNAVSAIEFLRLAQESSSPGTNGILELTRSNYLAMGNSARPGYGSTLLKDYDPALWAKITNSFSGWDADFVHVYLTPARIKDHTQYFYEMAAVILGESQYSFITSGDLNCGEGDVPTTNPYGFTLTSTGGGGDYSGLNSAANGGNGDDGLTEEEYYFVTYLWGIDPALAEKSLQKVEANNSPKYSIVTDKASSNPPNTIEKPTQNLMSATQVGQTSLTETPSMTAFAKQQAPFTQTSSDPSANMEARINGGAFPGSVGSQNLNTVLDPVNPVSGAFHVDDTDLGLPGPFPLAVRRIYSSQNLSDRNNFGYGWMFNLIPYILVTQLPGQAQVLFAAEEDGSIVAYRQTNSDHYLPTLPDNPSLNNNTPEGIGSVANMFNARIVHSVSGTTQLYTLTGPDGSQRVYQQMSFPLVGNTNSLNRTRPYLISWTDNRGNSRTFYYGTNSTTTDYGQVNRVQSSNGSFIGFEYNEGGYITRAFTGDGRQVTYDYDQFGDLTTVTLPDNSQKNYQYHHYSFSLDGVSLEDSDHTLVEELKPDGRVLKNVYDSERRVVVQMATVGPDYGVYTNALFAYSNNFVFVRSATNFTTGSTLITDVNQQVTRYDYTSNLITQITDPLNQTIQQNWFFTSDLHGAYQRSLQSSIDKRGLTNSYVYDTNGNCTNITLSGTDLTGDGRTTAVSAFTYNTNNMVMNETDRLGNTFECFYENTNYPYLPTSLRLYAADGTSIRTNTLIYTNWFTIVTNGPIIFTNSAYGLPSRIIRADNSSDSATSDFIFDGRGLLSSRTDHSGTGDPDVVNYFYYDDRGALIEKTDAGGRSTVLSYDDMDRPIGREVYEPNSDIPLLAEYLYYDDNGEPNWYDGPRSNPEDYIFWDYDAAGRLTQEIHWRSRAKSDGSGVEAETGDNLYATTFSEYDMFGNQTSVSDQYGDVARMSYDAIGQMLGRRRYGPNSVTPLTVEQFAYEPGGLVSVYTNVLGGVVSRTYTTAGQLKQQVNADGTTNSWVYDLDGRLKVKTMSNGQRWTNSYDDAHRLITRTFSGDSGFAETRVFDRRGNIVLITNAVGAVFTNYYDGLDRIKLATGPPTVSGVSTQQTSIFYYDNCGRQLIVSNALDEYTLSIRDALGRTITNEVHDSSGARTALTTYSYAPDFNSVTATIGSGSGAISNTVFTDTYGKPVLKQAFPSPGVTTYTLNKYDILENLIVSQDELGHTNGFSYDPLSRLQTQVLADGTSVGFGYNAAGSLTSRQMPGGLAWSAVYDSANRVLSEQLAAGGQTNRQFTYNYYTSGANIGLLQSVEDVGRGVTESRSYDSYLRVITNSATGSLPDQNVAVSYQYDRRGLATNVTQTGASSANTVLRSFDGYGQMTEEEVTVNGLPQSDFDQAWDAAGRRAQLVQSGAGLGGSIRYSHRADGLLSGVAQGGLNFTFGYGDNGLLTTRSNSWRQLTVSQRDGLGRVLWQTNEVGSGYALVEGMTYRANSTLNSYQAYRNGAGAWNDDGRQYSYNSRDQLTSEPMDVAASTLATNSYTFDANKVGVLTAAQWSGGLTNSWQATGLSSFSQVTVEGWKQSGLTLRASGSAVNASSVTTTLDGNTLGNVFSNGRWYADTNLSTGSHTLAATASYNVGQYSGSASSTFTVIGTNGVTDYYDLAGNVTNRVFTSGKTQALTWDGFGRLVGVTQRESTNTGSGFNWTAIYDAGGRRLRTVMTPVVSNVVNSAMTLTLDSYYDPQVEFEEVAVGINGQRTWKVLGPDLGGVYGRMHGVGGLEATFRENGSQTNGVLNDCFGNVLATVSGTTVNWSPVRVGGYGPVLGYEAPTLTLSTPLAETELWRSRNIDPSGFYYLGARYYDPMAGRFLSADPYGHAASMDLYSAFFGDPVNCFDPDGRYGKQAWNFSAGAGKGFVQGYYGSYVTPPANTAEYYGQGLGRTAALGLSVYQIVSGSEMIGTGGAGMAASAGLTLASAGAGTPGTVPAFGASSGLVAAGVLDVGLGLQGLRNYMSLNPLRSPSSDSGGGGGDSSPGQNSSQQGASTGDSNSKAEGEADLTEARQDLADVLKWRERQLVLGQDPITGYNPNEGIAGARLESYLGRELERSLDGAADLMDKELGPISLKGPIPPWGDLQGLANSAIRDAMQNTATRTLVIDTYGLSPDEIRWLKSTIADGTKGSSKSIIILE